MPNPKTTKPADSFVAGLDAGGTKTVILDSLNPKLHHYQTNDFKDLESLLTAYFAEVGDRPKKMVVALAGPRNDATGEIKMTNCPWPVFNPHKAAQQFPGTTFVTTNDMVATSAGAVHASSMDLQLLKAGKASPVGSKLTITISTGVGTCIAAWDEQTKRYVFVPGEGGHAGFQPYNAAERRHLAHIFKKYEHPSVELAISGKFGIPHWVEHSPETKKAPELSAALERAQKDGRPIGAVLLEFAETGSGAARTAARTLLGHMGGLVGNVLADLALTAKATGGIYLTGSVSFNLSEYWAEHTGMNAAFVRRGTPEHSPWLEEVLGNIPIYLITDPYVAAKGALALAKE
jgi:glucokinase